SPPRGDSEADQQWLSLRWRGGQLLVERADGRSAGFPFELFRPGPPQPELPDARGMGAATCQRGVAGGARRRVLVPRLRPALHNRTDRQVERLPALVEIPGRVEAGLRTILRSQVRPPP